MAISQRRMTFEEFLALPEEKPALEYIDGWVRQKAIPNGPHGALQSWFAHLILAFAVPIKLAWAFTETRVRLGGDALVPDLAIYRWERIPRDADGEVAEDTTLQDDDPIDLEAVLPGFRLTVAELFGALRPPR
jgi:Uma2 family endonuclease